VELNPKFGTINLLVMDNLKQFEFNPKKMVMIDLKLVGTYSANVFTKTIETSL
jgi:hypothetical protein